MASSANPDILRFKSQLAQFRDIWRSVIIRYSCRKVGSGWLNVVSEARLSPDQPESTVPVRYANVDDFRAGQYAAPVDWLDHFFESAENWTVDFEGLTVRLYSLMRGAANDLTEQRYGWTTRTLLPEGGWRSFWGPGDGSVTFQLEGSGQPWNQTLQRFEKDDLEQTLRVSESSFLSLDDLAKRFLGYNSSPFDSMSNVTITAPLYARMSPMEVPGTDEVVFKFEAPPTTSARDFRLLIRAFVDGAVVGGSEEFEGAGPPAEPSLTFSKSVSIPGAEWIEGHLLFRNYPVGTASLYRKAGATSNVRLAAFSSFDEAPGRLAALQQGDVRGLREHENSVELAVSWVLTICGFQVFPSDVKSYTFGGSAPDLVAFVPFWRGGLVVECSTWRPSQPGQTVGAPTKNGPAGGGS